MLPYLLTGTKGDTIINKADKLWTTDKKQLEVDFYADDFSLVRRGK